VAGWTLAEHGTNQYAVRKIIKVPRPGGSLIARQAKCVGTHQLYVCLSYVWGVASPQGNVPGTGVSGFPQTVCDAISVTRRLGYGYLWVDRYCIDQHDSEYKHSAIRSMGFICTYALVYVISVRPWFAASIGNQVIPDSIPGRVRL
jgi:hypothetical protein